MAILLTGGAGKTSRRIAGYLQDAKIPFLMTSRRGQAAAPPGMQAVKFDWLDSSTFEAPFEYQFPNGEKITAIYLVSPETPDPEPSMTSFIDQAVQKYGVKKFVLFTGSSAQPGGPSIGGVWQHLIDIGVEYCVLRATWFMDNFAEPGHLQTIKYEGKIYSACEDGKIPFISAQDIAALAFHVLTENKPHDKDYRILGPELLTFDQVAAKLTKALGREIEHVRISQDEATKRLLNYGLPDWAAGFLASLEAMTAKGMEDRTGDEVKEVTGKAPQTFDDWIQENKAMWQ